MVAFNRLFIQSDAIYTMLCVKEAHYRKKVTPINNLHLILIYPKSV